MNDLKELLVDFVQWAENCGQDVYFIFDHPEKAVNQYLIEKEYR